LLNELAKRGGRQGCNLVNKLVDFNECCSIIICSLLGILGGDENKTRRKRGDEVARRGEDHPSSGEVPARWFLVPHLVHHSALVFLASPLSPMQPTLAPIESSPTINQ